MNPFTVLFAALDAIAIAIYIRDSLGARNREGVHPVAASTATLAVIMVAFNEIVNETSVFFVLCFAMLFALLPFYYMRDNRKLLFFLFLTMVEFFYVTYSYGTVLYPFIQALAIGTAYGFISRNGLRIFEHRLERSDRRVETRRDVMHILLGLVVFGLFVLLPFYYAEYVTTTMILVGYTYNSLLGGRRRGWPYSFLMSLERQNSMFGLGALYLGVGTALLMGFIHSMNFVAVGIAALFLADPVATIVGINTNGPKLPYNDRKSVFGTLAFFLTVTVFGYPYIGAYALLFGACLAVAESVEIPVDDNISIPVFMVVLYVLFLAARQMPPF